jgi:hypothetical protein
VGSFERSSAENNNLSARFQMIQINEFYLLLTKLKSIGEGSEEELQGLDIVGDGEELSSLIEPQY